MLTAVEGAEAAKGGESQRGGMEKATAGAERELGPCQFLQRSNNGDPLSCSSAVGRKSVGESFRT